MPTDDAALAIVAAAPDVQGAIAGVRDSLGLAHVTWHLMVNAGAPLDNPYVRTTYPAPWVSHYLLNTFAQSDPVVRHGLACRDPFFWSDLAVGADGARVLAAAVAHGVPVQGFSVPHVDAMQRRSLFSVSLDGTAETVRARLQPRVVLLGQLATAIHHMALAEGVPPDTTRPRLSKREVECLRWVAQGKSHTDIAVILGLSQHTVRSYLRTVRERLECVSLAQAVTKATQMRLL